MTQLLHRIACWLTRRLFRYTITGVWGLNLLICTPLHAACNITSGTAPTVYGHGGQSKQPTITASIGSHPFDFAGAAGTSTWASSCSGSDSAGFINLVGSNTPLGSASGNYGNSNGNPIYGIDALPGIGFAPSWNLSSSGLNAYFQPYGTLSAPTNYNLNDAGTMRIDFFVTSALWAGSWCLPTGASLGEIRFGSQAVARLQVTGSPLCITVTGRTCSVTSASQNLGVPLGSYSLAQFTGIGYTTPARSFNIQLQNCTGGVAKVNMMFNATADNDYANAANLGIIKLSPSGATGVAVQLLRGDGSTLPLNSFPTSPIWSGSQLSEGGSLNVPLKVRYIQTKNSVTAGQANATSTFNVIYQ